MPVLYMDGPGPGIAPWTGILSTSIDITAREEESCPWVSKTSTSSSFALRSGVREGFPLSNDPCYY